MGFLLGYLLGRAASDELGSESASTTRDPGDGYILPDERARQDARAQLAADPALDANDVEVRVLSGELTLTGNVRDESMKARAAAVCASIGGVTKVHNELVAARPSGRP